MTSRHAPCVSVGMPVFDSEVTITAAIRSILNQTFSDWELLIIDDGSSDGTIRLARAYSDPRIHVFSDGTHQGLAARLNQLVRVSGGKYFARMDGDDVSYPERLALQVKYMERHPEVDLLGGGVLVFGRDGKPLGTRKVPTTHESICRRPWKGFYLTHPTWMGRTKWFHEHPYSSDAPRCEDQDLLLRTHECSRFAALPEIVLGYREEQLSLTKILTSRKYFAAAVVRRAISRQEYLIAAAALIEQALKGVADSVAIITGLNHRLLRHRALPIAGAAPKQRWQEVWEKVQLEKGAFHSAAS